MVIFSLYLGFILYRALFEDQAYSRVLLILLVPRIQKHRHQ